MSFGIVLFALEITGVYSVDHDRMLSIETVWRFAHLIREHIDSRYDHLYKIEKQDGNCRFLLVNKEIK